MSAAEPIALIVSLEKDAIGAACREALQARGVTVRSIPPALLGEARLALAPSQFRFEGMPVRGLLLRTPPCFPVSARFDSADQAFADSEIGATLLAAASLSSLIAVNRFDATAWFENGRWSVWHQRLEVAGVPVTTFEAGPDPAGDGGWWHPHTTFTAIAPPAPAAMAAFTGLTTTAVAGATYLAVGGNPIDPVAPPTVFRTAAVLEREGLAFAAITVDQDGAIHKINPFPEAADPAEAARAGQALAEHIHGHWHRW
jgi:hypothetical protein